MKAPPTPLGDLRVLECGADPTVAFAARLLGDLGAEVIKVEPPEGDPLRRASGTCGISEALFAYLNNGKRSVTVDAATAAGARLLRDLSARCGLLLSDAATAAAAERLAGAPGWPERPPTVLVSPFGRDGSDAGRPSSPFTLQHASGFAFHQASPVAAPASTPPVGCADWEGSLAPGIAAAVAALWLVRGAGKARPGPVVDLSVQDALAYLLVEPFADWQGGANVSVRQRDPAKGLTIAGGLVWLLPCSDGFIMVSPREDHQWRRWVALMGDPPWAADDALCRDRAVRTANAALLQSRMAAWSAGRSVGDVVARAQASRVACFPVSTPRDLLDNPQLHERGFFVRPAGNGAREVPMPGLPFRFVSPDGTELPRGGRVRVPAAGADTERVLDAWLGRAGREPDGFGTGSAT